LQSARYGFRHPPGGSKNKRLLRKIYIAALACLCTSGCSEGTTRAVLATVLAVDGRCAVRGVRAQEAGLLHPGAALALLPNVRIDLMEHSELQIVRLFLTKDGNETGNAMRNRQVEVKLLRGSAVISQVLGDWAQSKVYVETPNGTLLGNYEALLRIEYADETTRALCVSGIVEFRPADSLAAISLPRGSAGEWRRGQSRIFLAETDARGQEDLQEALEVEQRLRGLMNRLRYVLPR
jgi:hypothetical protein